MAGPENLKCPFCNGTVALSHDVCPHCNASLLIDFLEKTQITAPLGDFQIEQGKFCEICRKPIAPGRHVCQECASDNRTIPGRTKKSKWDTHGDSRHDEKVLLIRDVEDLVLPRPLLTSAEIGFDSLLFDKILEIESDQAPKAIISTDDKRLFYLVAGSTLVIGRELETSHIQTILHPEQQHAKTNFKISRKHCSFTIRDNRAFCRDLSSNGTMINELRIDRKKDIPLIDGDLVSLAKSLELRVRLSVIDDRISCMLLERTNNGQESRYILSAGPVLFGDDRRFPIVIPQLASVRGSVYFDPLEQVWILSVSKDGHTLIAPRPLDFIEDIMLPGGGAILFSTIQ